jgi:hypothetical protein
MVLGVAALCVPKARVENAAATGAAFYRVRKSSFRKPSFFILS